MTIASILVLTGLLVMQTVDQALAGVVLPSGAGTLTIGPQAMEGNLQIHPGDTIRAGYDFTMPGAHAAAQVTVDNASITMAVTCSNGTTPPLITFALPVQTYSDPAGSPSWYPSGDQSTIAVYQGSVRAPDLCGGGIMSDANGATFKATVFSTDTTDKVNVRFHYSDNTAGSWSATITSPVTPTAKTVLSATLTPSLGLTLAVDHSSAIPGDTLTYSGTVTNTGATLTLTGDFTASASGSSTATVTSYWDDVATSLDSTTWTPLAGTAAAQSGYTPAVASPIASGMSLTSTPVASGGVTYPSSGDPLLGTTIASGSSALWHYTASVPLTPSQVTTLLDPTKVQAIRNSFHLEVSPANPNTTQPSIINVDFSGIFFGASPAPSGAVTNVTVAVQPPTGSPIQITSAQVTGLASLSPGGSAKYSATYQVPAVAVRGTTETEAAYVARLKAIEGTTLSASATASGTSTGGNITTGAPAVSTTEHLPIMTLTKSGPATVPAGTTGTFPLTLQNTGGAPASGMAITDTVPSGATGTVSGIPTTLAPGASSSGTQATFLVPVNQSAGSLTDTAGLTWQDANANVYGPVSSMFTTQVQAANKLSITGGAGPNPTGATEAIKATLVDLNGQPVANQNVFLNVTGANTQQSTVTTDASGVATFSYLGSNAGTDTLQASTTNGVQSNTLIVTWFTPIQKVSSTAVQGNFYAEPTNPQSFVVTPQSVPDFGQNFPTIDFNPPAGTIPHSPAGAPTDQTRPFTDVTTDVNGNYNGTIVAQGNNLQAGVGNLTNFDAVFTANLIVAQAGDVTFNIYANDGFLFGVGNGATRVSGVYENPPGSNLTAIQGYPLMGAFNLPGAGTRPVTVHFPAAGTYPYEVDYFEANADALSLTMSVATFTAQTNPLSIYVGYADGLRAAGSIFPFPWLGSPGVTFIGCCPSFDAGAIRFDNSSSNAIVLDSVTVDIGGNHFDLWGRNLTVPANQILMMSQTGQFNFDTSDYSGAGCGGNNGVIPKVNVTIAGVTTSYNDTNQILNTFGFDLACRGNESQSWQRIGGGGNTINVPLPPATTLALTPATVTGNTVGQTQTFTVAAMDATGQSVVNLPVTLTITGANGGSAITTTQLNATTDSGGLAKFSYVGLNAGTDSVQVNAFVMGLRSVSNAVSVPWSLSTTPGGGMAPAPAITSPSPADGATVTTPVPVSASFTPSAGQTITSWSVTYQGASPTSPVVTLATGTGAPPATLGTFDPTLLANDTYNISISATGSGGGTQTLSTGVIVSGNLKLGRYITTYQDLSVPVNGFQMEVRRVYDSTDHRIGDFGIGWHEELANFRVTTNRQLGAGGWTQYNSFCGIGLCLTAFKTSVPHVVTVTYPDGHQDEFTFTPTGGTNIFGGAGVAFTARQGTTSTLQALGDTSLSYTFDGNLYGSNGQPYNPTRFQLTTRDGRVLIVDSSLGLISIKDRSGNTLTVDSGGVHSTSGQSITFSRDAVGRITQITGPSNQVLAYSYSSAGDLASYTNAIGGVSTYQYDAAHNLLHADATADGPALTQGYDASGRLTSITDATGHTTGISSNIGALTQTVVDPNGQLTTVNTYDAVGDHIQQDNLFNGRDQKWTYTYDALGNMLSATEPSGATRRTTYDANGNVLTTTDPLMNVTTFTYDASGNLSSIARPDHGIDQSFTYDSSGRIASTSFADGSQQAFTYDAAGHLTSSQKSGEGQLQISYDAGGHPSTLTDTQGDVVQLSYDASGRLLSMGGPLSVAVSYQYDGLGDMTSSTDATGGVQHFTYDPLGRQTQVTDAASKSTSLTYDSAGNVASLTDRLGVVTNYSYDAAGHLTKVAGGSATKNFTYDPLGKLISAVNSTATVQLTYDDAGRVTTQSESGPSLPSTTVQNTYDAAGNLTSISGPQGMTTRTYDQDGRLTSIQDRFGTSTLAYDNASRLTSLSRPNGAVDQFTYDAAGRLIGQTTAVGGSPVNAIGYGYTDTSSLASTATAGDTATFGRDAAGRLTSAQHTDTTRPPESFAYDNRGNRTSWSGQSGGYAYGANDQLLSSPASTYTYDAEGQRTSMLSSGFQTTYAWTPDHQLASVTAPDGSSSSFQYDALGHRILAMDGSTAHAFVYDGEQLVAEYQNASLAAAYTPGVTADRPLNTSQNGQPYYYVQNQHNDVTALLDGTGAVAQRYSYSAYGVATATTPTVSNPLTFGAAPYEKRAGAYYNRARYYDPTNGVFLSQDPQTALNPYSYVGGDPIDFGDPSGRAAVIEIAGIFKWDLSLRSMIFGCLTGILGNLLGTLYRVHQGAVPNPGVAGANLVMACAFGAVFPGYIGKTVGAFGAYLTFSFVLSFIYGVIVDALDQRIQCGSFKDPGQALQAGLISGGAGVLGGAISAATRGAPDWVRIGGTLGSTGAKAGVRTASPAVTC